MRIAYLDCFAGVAGDMFLGALVDAGVPRAVLEEATAALHLGASLRFETANRSGISATKVYVMEGERLAEATPPPAAVSEPVDRQVSAWQPRQQQQHRGGHSHPFAPEGEMEVAERQREEVQGRSLAVIRELILRSSLAEEVKRLATRAFELLGASEAKIHNVPVDTVHFHEVGSVDALVDIVASAAGIVHLNIAEWHCSPLNVGGGFVRCAHGVFPVPAPATADLLRGLPTYSAHLQKELVTPTGAAIVRALAPSFGQQPAMTVERIGYGAGTRDPASFPNVLRLSIGESDLHAVATPVQPREQGGETDSPRSAQVVSVIETAMDDATPQLLGYVTERLLGLGVLDVMLTPVIMKKGRPGTLLTVLCDPTEERKFEELLLRETTTLGVRVRQDRRVCLEREHVTVQTQYGSIRVKTGRLGRETLQATPEYEDCRRAAQESGVPLKQVQTAAMTTYLAQTAKESEA